jgi:hypothetical protein
MDHTVRQRLCGEEDGYSRHGRVAVSAENLPIILVGHTSCEPLPLGDVRPVLAASISVTRVLFLCPQPRLLGFDLGELVGQNKDFVGVEDRGFPRPSKGWRILWGILCEEVAKETHGRVRHLLIESTGTKPHRSQSSFTGSAPGFCQPGRRHHGCFCLTKQDEHNGQATETQ